MESPIHTKVAQKYQGRDDILDEYSHGFNDNPFPPLDRVPTSTEKELDAKIKSALKYIHGTRDEMHDLVEFESASPNDLADLVEEARKVYKATTFQVRRHYQAKEEGIRLRCEKDAEAREKSISTSPIRALLIDSLHFFRLRVLENAAMLKKAQNSRLSVLEEAMVKVEYHQQLALMQAKGLLL